MPRSAAAASGARTPRRGRRVRVTATTRSAERQRGEPLVRIASRSAEAPLDARVADVDQERGQPDASSAVAARSDTSPAMTRVRRPSVDHEAARRAASMPRAMPMRRPAVFAVEERHRPAGERVDRVPRATNAPKPSASNAWRCASSDRASRAASRLRSTPCAPAAASVVRPSAARPDVGGVVRGRSGDVDADADDEDRRSRRRRLGLDEDAGELARRRRARRSATSAGVDAELREHRVGPRVRRRASRRRAPPAAGTSERERRGQRSARRRRPAAPEPPAAGGPGGRLASSAGRRAALRADRGRAGRELVDRVANTTSTSHGAPAEARRPPALARARPVERYEWRGGRTHAVGDVDRHAVAPQARRPRRRWSSLAASARPRISRARSNRHDCAPRPIGERTDRSRRQDRRAAVDGADTSADASPGVADERAAG